MNEAAIPISKEECLAIHRASIEKFGGVQGVRDKGLLESALAQPFQSFAGVDLYPSLTEKAARYAFGIISNHPFADGNKRTATAVMGAFLRINGCHFKPRHDELLAVMYGLAAGQESYADLVRWLTQTIN